MITRSGLRIRRTDPYRHKFADALSEFLYDECMDRWAYDSSGDADAPCGWFVGVGRKRILMGDYRGFVEVVRYRSELERDAALRVLEGMYEAWLEGDAR